MIEVLQAGFYTTIQDHGRWGFRKWGVPVSGPMDRAAADLANQLVHNSAEEAVIEISLQGPELRFEETLYFERFQITFKLDERVKEEDIIVCQGLLIDTIF